MGRLVEAYWDCDSCDTKGIRGNLRECPNCGKPRNDETKFYLNKNKTIYVSDEKAETINKNPDWVCEYCESLNSDNDKFCKSCGAARTNENLNYFENHEEKKKKDEEKNAYKSKNEETVRHVHTEKTTKSSYIFETSKSHSKSKSFKFPVRIFLITLASLLVIFGLIYLFIPKEQEILIQELSWEYTINIEKFQTVNENGLSLPTNARLQRTEKEISHYVKIIDHYETKTRQVEKQKLVGYEEYTIGYKDLGNGYFEEETSLREIYEPYYVTEIYEEPVYINQPVYQTRYYYEIDKWVHERTVTTNGNTMETYWGETNLLENERISSKVESYFVSGINTKKNEETKIKVSFEDWNQLKTDIQVKFKVSLGYGELVKEY